MNSLDFVLTPIYLAIFYFIAVRTRERHSENPLYKRYYMRGLTFKLGGSLFFSIIYIFYYKGGDSLNYYYAISPLYKAFFSSPGNFFGFVFSLDGAYPWE